MIYLLFLLMSFLAPPPPFAGAARVPASADNNLNDNDKPNCNIHGCIYHMNIVVRGYTTNIVGVCTYLPIFRQSAKKDSLNSSLMFY